MCCRWLPRAFLTAAALAATLPVLADEGGAQQPATASRKPQAERAQQITRVFRVEHGDAAALGQLIGFTGPAVRVDSTLRVVVLSGRRDQVEAAEAVLAKLDVPREVPLPRDVVFDVYLIGAYLEAMEFPAMPVTPQAAVDGIRQTFPFASYRLLEAFVIRASPGGNDAQVKGYLDSDHVQSIEHLAYQFEVRVKSGQSTPDSIGLSDVLLTLQAVLEGGGVQESEIQTSLTTREGKTVVVGKAGVRGVADGIFLVLKARFD